MDDDARRAAGAAMRRTVLGDAHVAATGKSDVTAEFDDLSARYTWSEIWTRTGLDVRTRRVLVLGTLVALGRWDELRIHVRAALTVGGFSVADLNEILLQQTVYCGVPTGHAAFGVLRQVVDDLRT